MWLITIPTLCQDSSRAHGHIHDGVFDSKVVTGEGQHLQIELASKYFKESTFIYDEHDVITNTTASCGAKDQLLNKLRQLQTTCSANDVILSNTM